MDKNLKRNILIIVFAGVTLAVVLNINSILKALSDISGLLAPIIYGFVLAFILNVPMSGIEKLLGLLFKSKKNKKATKFVKTLSLLLLYAIIIFIFYFTVTLFLPSFISSSSGLYDKLMAALPEWADKLKEYNIDISSLIEKFKSIDIKNILSELSSGAGVVFSSTISIISKTVSSIATIGIAFVISTYVLLYKDSLIRQIKKLLGAYTKPSFARKISKIASMFCNTFRRFLSGQCIEAIILGLLIFFSFLLFRIPYAGLVALMSAVLSFIPYIGPFISCFVSALLILITNPGKCILSIVVFLGVQYIEEQFIYPRVIGSSVGLPPLWTIIAVITGGGLFGVLGVFFSIPVTSVLYAIIKQDVNKKLDTLSP